MFPRGELVVKLPKARVDELVDAGAGRRFDPGHGRVMKEWIVVAPGKADWLALANEAFAYLGARTSRPQPAGVAPGGHRAESPAGTASDCGQGCPRSVQPAACSASRCRR